MRGLYSSSVRTCFRLAGTGECRNLKAVYLYFIDRNMDVDGDGFGDLVQQAQQLTADMDSGLELPRVERNLFQIRDAAQRMASKAPVVGQESTDVKASLLLGSRGYDVQKVSQKLETLSSAKTFEPLEPVRDTDIQV